MKGNGRIKVRLSAAALFIFFQFAGVATESQTLDVITVKGTKEEKSYLEITESVSILQENESPAAGRENSIQVLNAVPNVQVNKNGESFSIRGINNTGVTGFQKDNLSSILVDDVFQTDLAVQAGSFDLWDVERIEVLRGAQSTSQGVNSLAGSILLDHHRPQLVREGAAKFGVGNFNHREIGAVTNHILMSDKLALRASYNKEMDDGYIKNITTGNTKWGRQDHDRINLGLIYQWTPAETLELNAKFHQNRQGGAYVQGSRPFAFEVSEDQDFDLSTQNRQTSIRHSRPFGSDWMLRSTIGFSESNQDGASDADGTAQNTAGTRLEKHQDQFASFESRLHYKSERWSNVLGIHAHNFRLKGDYDFILLFPIAGGTPVAAYQGVRRSRETMALFDSLTYHLTENHSLLGGVRVENVRSKFTTDISGNRLADVGAGSNAAVDAYVSQISGEFDGGKSGAVVLPKVGYGFKTGEHHTGLTYTRGYRTSGISINRNRATIVEYAPEFTENYEAFYKYVEDGDQIAASLFYIDWKAQQVEVQLSSHQYDKQVENAGKSEVMGGELEGKSMMSPEHTLSTGVGYAHTKFKQFESRGVSYAGKKFPFASEWTFRTSHQWRTTENLTLLTTARYLSEAFSDVMNSRKADAQFYVDLNAKYLLRSWVFEAYVNNVLDGRYRIYDGTPLDSTSPFQVAYHQTSTPREVGIRANLYW